MLIEPADGRFRQQNITIANKPRRAVAVTQQGRTERSIHHSAAQTSGNLNRSSRRYGGLTAVGRRGAAERLRCATVEVSRSILHAIALLGVNAKPLRGRLAERALSSTAIAERRRAGSRRILTLAGSSTSPPYSLGRRF